MSAIDRPDSPDRSRLRLVDEAGVADAGWSELAARARALEARVAAATGTHAAEARDGAAPAKAANDEPTAHLAAVWRELARVPRRRPPLWRIVLGLDRPW